MEFCWKQFSQCIHRRWWVAADRLLAIRCDKTILIHNAIMRTEIRYNLCISRFEGLQINIFKQMNSLIFGFACRALLPVRPSLRSPQCQRQLRPHSIPCRCRCMRQVNEFHIWNVVSVTVCYLILTWKSETTAQHRHRRRRRCSTSNCKNLWNIIRCETHK